MYQVSGLLVVRVLTFFVACFVMPLAVAIDDGGFISVLNTLAIGFTVYMVIAVVLTFLVMPELERRALPKMKIPETISRETAHEFEVEKRMEGDAALFALIEAIRTKIGKAADESAIYAFAQGKLAVMRREITGRYAPIAGAVKTLGFEGIIGTLLGLIVFMAQATRLFKFPSIEGREFDSVEFINTIIANLSAIDLRIVATAFITSIIGWGANAYIGRFAEKCMGEELGSVQEAEGWLYDVVFPRLHIPSQAQAILRLADIPDLREPMEVLGRGLDKIGGLAEVLGRHGGTVALKMRYVEGGVRFELLPPDGAPADTSEVKS